MALSTWWQDREALPTLPFVAGFRAEVSRDVQLLAHLAALPTSEITSRLSEGHTPYVAYLENIPVGYGWVARQQATIGELALTFRLPAHNRYLWDFQILPRWRGKGFYPQLLQFILKSERKQGANRFWIISAPENLASTAGIAKAGFSAVGNILFVAEKQAALLPFRSHFEQARVGAELLSLSFTQTEPETQCWHCIISSPDGCQCQATKELDLENYRELCSCVEI